MSSLFQSTYTFTISTPLPQSTQPPAHTKEKALSLLHNHTRFCGLQPVVQSVRLLNAENDEAVRELATFMRDEWRNVIGRSTEVPEDLTRTAEYLRRRADEAETETEPKSTPETPPIQLYRLAEKLPYIGIVKFPALMQDTADGVVSYAKAALGTGVCNWWGVCLEDVTPSPKGRGGEVNESNMANVKRPFLKHYVTLKANRLLMPFIKGNTEEAHRGMHVRFVEELQKELDASG